MTGRKRSSVGQVVAGLVVGVAVCVTGTLAAADKYALLVAVTKYEHADMNRPQPLEFPEADAAALAVVLRAAGYTTEVLAGPQATKERIEAALAGLRGQGNDTGAVMVAFFGHGVELGVTQNNKVVDESFFCPYDVSLRFRRDAQGREVPGDNGKPLIEPDPNDCVGMTAVFNALRVSKAGRRIVIADCCRNDPTAARGRSFGANVSTADLPERTAALFSCSSGEKAFEDSTSRHGVFTKALLDRIARHRGAEPLTAAMLGEHLEDEVPQRVKQLTKGAKQQTPRYVSISKVDLLLGPGRAVAPPLLRAPFTPTEAAQAQQAWSDYLGIPKTKLEQRTGVTLALLPPGAFTMGSPPGETGRGDDESPHSVRITKPYYLGIHEVTVGQFRKFVTAAGYKTEAEKDGEGGYGWNEAIGKFEAPKPAYTWRNPGFVQTDEHPVVNVSWNDAQAYCSWLSGESGATYRLPTEAEWEYACRAGTTTAYWNGDDDVALTKVGNILDATAKAKLTNYRTFPYSSGRDGYVFTAPVGKYVLNGFGFYDMHGNVWEWCQDVNGAYDLRREADPVGPAQQENSDRVIRGGGWRDSPRNCRSAYRDGESPGSRFYFLGFRLALVAELSSSNW